MAREDRQVRLLSLLYPFEADQTSTWRPIKTIDASPLALCDYHTLAFHDLIETDLVSEDYVGETYSLKHNPDHRFYWLSKQVRLAPASPFGSHLLLGIFRSDYIDHMDFLHLSFLGPASRDTL